MAKSNPRGSAIQAALQGFSGTFFPLAQQQIAAQQEMEIRGQLQQQELANALQLAQEKSMLETQQRQSALEQALSLGDGSGGFRVKGIGESGFPTFERSPKKLSAKEWIDSHGVTPEQAKIYETMDPEDAIKHIGENRKSKTQARSDELRAEQLNIQKENARFRRFIETEKTTTGLQKEIKNLEKAVRAAEANQDWIKTTFPESWTGVSQEVIDARENLAFAHARLKELSAGGPVKDKATQPDKKSGTLDRLRNWKPSK